MKYFVCNCFYELKLRYGVISIKKLTLKDLGFRYTTSVKNDCCYICCRETILFLFEYYRNSNFYFAIADDRVFSKLKNLFRFANISIVDSYSVIFVLIAFLKLSLGCLHHKMLLQNDCCLGCVNYIIEHYSTMFLTTI